VADAPFRRLPAVHVLLAHPLLAGRPHAAEAARAELAAARDRLRLDPDAVVEIEHLAASAAAMLSAAAGAGMRPVINATGIILHTNLGRAPLAEAAALAAYHAGRAYASLELDLATGERAGRQRLVRDGICRLTGADAATAVNNCAAATVLTLRALAAGREVIVSRGQLVEIGGNYRLPDILTASGAVLREVGTTNITRPADYAGAINPRTAMILRVHTSNFRVRGFTRSVPLEDLARIGQAAGIPVVDDAGSGAAFDGAGGSADEPDVRRSLSAGADLVLFSGDKLLGGPQAGLIAGRPDHIAAIERDPLMRAFRLDKMTVAALAATLELHAAGAIASIPVVAMLTRPAAELRPRAEALAAGLNRLPGVAAEVVEATGYAGGGSTPDEPLPSVAVALTVEGESAFARRLRLGNPAVLARVHAGRVWLDLRTVFERDDAALLATVLAAAG